MPLLHKVAIILGLSVAGGGISIAEVSATPPTGSASTQPPIKQPPSKDDAWLQPATRESAERQADDLLEELRRKRPANEVIPPASAALKPKPTPVKFLAPEGSALVDRSGRLSADVDGWRFLFDDEAALSLRVLPNSALEMMVRTAVGTAEGMRFLISAEVTVFEDENYLLVRLARRASGGGAVRHPEAAASGFPVTGIGLLLPEPTPKPTTPPVEKVLETLRDQQPQRPAIPVAGESQRSLTTHKGGVTRSLRPDGSPVIRRPGRVLREGAWWTFVPESDHPDQAEPSLKVLPNQTLQAITRGGSSDQPGAVFQVSGEVTLFQGENYLLARSVLRNVDLGNLRR